jgi:hypothetical protein
MRKLLAAAVIALALAGCTQVAEPPQPTDAELDAYILEQQDRQWYEYGSPQFVRPEVQSQLVEPNKYNDPDESCGAGVVSIIDIDGGIVSVTAVPSSETAQYECHVAQISYPSSVEYYTSDQLGFLYDYYRDVLVPCLQMQGLVVTYAPTREEFSSAPGLVPWDPYTQLGADLPPSRAAEIHQRCAALPTADFLDPR